MKRSILIKIVLVAAIGAIYYMVVGWQKEQQSEVANADREEREVFGMSASGQAASSREFDSLIL